MVPQRQIVNRYSPRIIDNGHDLIPELENVWHPPQYLEGGVHGVVRLALGDLDTYRAIEQPIIRPPVSKREEVRVGALEEQLTHRAPAVVVGLEGVERLGPLVDGRVGQKRGDRHQDLFVCSENNDLPITYELPLLDRPHS